MIKEDIIETSAASEAANQVAIAPEAVPVAAEVDTRDAGNAHGAMTPLTCRAARVLLKMDQIELARRAGVAVQTVRNYENGVSEPAHKTWMSLKRSLEQAGVQFIDENGGGVGVRLRERSK